jgi:hypothetical protein
LLHSKVKWVVYIAIDSLTARRAIQLRRAFAMAGNSTPTSA